ncbi:hypothetical protein CC1G_13673 [Coprinopsis cinerea okayama7|uniref:Uncharacterized protein n=1 Tax=Coprinopsis cinerea (strain Okayama-7 / 130 / ATCC MYA-4618 / FGSC 9003) TaxID=240176 RepID=D6RJV5_COPC7|nr:hypothetical protein CC1G_13673 [Coprinopsis cinerea okayama7\|eukprot:XP_002912141.1 hypothetical protein CC1G_13673 [Coprinopsis cinerea okayama7\
MPAAPTADIYYRADDEGEGLSRQNIIIIAACSSAAGLILCYFLYRTIRNCRRSANPAPLPPVQPLAHHREHRVAAHENSLSRPPTWFQPALPATHSMGSKASLLGKESPLLSGSAPSSSVSATESGQEFDLPPVSADSSQHLPLPSPSYHGGRPGSSSSYNSSDVSCASPHAFPLNSPDSAPPMPRPVADLRYGSPARRPRPLSMSSMQSMNSRTSRHTVRGLPHSPYNQVQIVLPTPLASTNNSRESLALSHRRSIVDSWLLPSSNADSPSDVSGESVQSSRSRKPQRPASMSSLRSALPKNDAHPVPPVPQIPSNLEATGQKSLRSSSDSRWTPSHQTVAEEDADMPRRPNKLGKTRPS